MKIIVNCSSLKTGGALQVGLSFLNEIINNKDHEFYVVLSDELEEQLNKDLFSKRFKFYNYSIRPTIANALFGFDSYLSSLEKKISPDVVFSVFGPTYWKPKSKHIVGYAKPQYIYKSETPFFDKISFLNKIKLWCKGKLHIHDFNNFASEYITESPDVSKKLRQILKSGVVHTVTNNSSRIYGTRGLWEENINLKSFDGITLLTISANYPHKNLNIIPKVVSFLRCANPNFKFRFILSIEENELGDISEEQKKHIIFLGKVNVNECPNLYSQSDIMFLPTLLECFSASYPEAMKMEVPIITSDLSFARGICEDAAYYVDPLSPKEIGEAIVKVSSDNTLQKKLIDSGRKQLKKFDTPEQRAKKYLQIIENAANNTRP